MVVRSFALADSASFVSAIRRRRRSLQCTGAAREVRPEEQSIQEVRGFARGGCVDVLCDVEFKRIAMLSRF